MLTKILTEFPINQYDSICDFLDVTSLILLFIQVFGIQ